jgi:hypothetical protein
VSPLTAVAVNSLPSALYVYAVVRFVFTLVLDVVLDLQRPETKETTFAS